MKKYRFVFLLVVCFSSCQEDIREVVPLNNHQTPPDNGGGDGGSDEESTVDVGIGVDNSNLMLGNPSGATAAVTDENNYLMNKGYYVVSYNRSRAIPNWVSWHLNSTSLGSTERSDDFTADTQLPAGWYRVSNSSYTGSGFTRGHNCPSGDRTSSTAANDATFLMTNMIPQASSNNSGLWATFEDYCRSQVSAGNEVYIVMGNYGKGGNGGSGGSVTGNPPLYAETIDNGNITVPKRIWKVAVIISNGDGDLNRITTSTRVIAIDTPNDNSGLGTWQSYRVSVDAIEAATGYDLLSILPDNIETALEAAVDTGS